MSLRLLQQQFLNQVLAGRSVSAEAWVKSKSAGERDARMRIYRDSYEGRTRSLLEEYFPVCARTLGRAKFARLARDFGAKRPARSPLLTAWGREFPAFLKSSKQPTWVVELARLEWELEVAPARTACKGRSPTATRPLTLAPTAELRSWNSRALEKFLGRRGLRAVGVWVRSPQGIQIWPLTAADEKLLRWLSRPRSIAQASKYCAKQGLSPGQVKRFFATAVARGWLANA